MRFYGRVGVNLHKQVQSFSLKHRSNGTIIALLISSDFASLQSRYCDILK